MFTTLFILLQATLLTGTPIGSTPSVDYTTGQASTTVNTYANAFDGDLNTCFASFERSYTWCGLDLGTPHIITRVAWSPRNDGLGPNRVVLGVFEGANRADFEDALPLYVITSTGTIGRIDSADVTVSRGFRYVRYVGPHDARCNIAELRFYGYAGEGDDSQLTLPAGIPYVSIHTSDGRIPEDKVNDIPCHTAVVWNGDLVYDTATVRLRGNASIQFPKKPFRIKFNKKKSVIGSPAKAKKWCLLNNYGDKTLMRNMVAMEYSRRLGMPYTPWMTPVEVYLNGEYQGCYQLADQLEIDKNKINITKLDSTEVTGGYHLEMDGYADQEPYHGWFLSNHYAGITIKEPDAEDITDAQYNYIRDYYNQMENAVFNVGNWRGMLDESTFLKHFLIGEYTGNTDTYWSMHMYKDRGNDTIFCGPEWDFDIAFDNDFRHYPTCNQSDFLYLSAGTNRDFVSRIVKQDGLGRENAKLIWSHARLCNGLTPDTICAYIDNVADSIGEAARRNFLRWPILNQNVHMNPRNAGSYQGEVNWLKTYIRNRTIWMDTHVGLDQQVLAVPPTTAAPMATKILRNGQLVIVRGDKEYTVLGQ